MLVYSGTIIVTFPNTGAMLYKGDTYKIVWNSTGCSSAVVKINIFKNSITTANFVEQLTSKTGNSLSWKVPNGYAIGKYVIRIKTDPAEQGCLGDSGVFDIGQKGTPPSNAVEFNPNKGNAMQRVLKNNTSVFLNTQLIRFYSPKSGYTWVPLKNYTISWTAQKSNINTSSFYFKISLVGAYSGQTVFKIADGGLSDPNLKSVSKADHYAYEYNFKFLGSYNIPPGQYKVRVESVTNPQLKGDSDVFSVESGGISPNTGFIGESDSDLSLENVYYDQSTQAIYASVRNSGFSTYNGPMSLGYNFILGISTYKDTNCPGNTKLDKMIKFPNVIFNKQEVKQFKLMDWKNCFLKRPGDYLPRTSPIKYTVSLYTNSNTGDLKSGWICGTQKSDIALMSPIFVILKNNTVDRLDTGSTATFHPDLFNWISPTQFKTTVAVSVMNFGCSAKTFSIDLFMDGPWLDGKKGVKLGTVTLAPGQEKYFESQPIVFSIPKSSNYEKIMLVADQNEKNDQGYPNSYMNNFIVANIRIYVVDNTVRGVL
jgi:hypothetical protein